MKSMKIDRRILLLFLVVALLAAFLVMFILREFVQQKIAVPISFILWLAGLVLKSIPQVFFLALLLTVAVYYALKSLSSAKPVLPIRTVEKIESRKRERVGFWLLQIYRARRIYSRQFVDPWGLKDPLKKLTQEVLAYRYHTSTLQVDQRMEKGEMDIPADIVEYLRSDEKPVNPFSTRKISKLRSWLESLVSQFYRSQPERPSGTIYFDRHLESLIEFLEDQLEINYDDRNP
ncbi:MAG: hypothetical protein ACM3PY_08265 [Omnitrophica WOR_2 bacterium]